MTLSPARKIADASAVPISYLEAGDGPALLLMHGIGGNARSWRYQLDGLSHRFRVIAWDAPGYGASAVRDATLEGYVAAVADLLDALCLDRAHVLGHSMGGVVAQGFAGAMADRVDKLILSATFTGDAAPAGEPLGGGWKARLEDIRTLSPEEFGAARAAGMLAPGASDAVRAEAASISAEVTHEGLLCGCMVLHHADTRDHARGLGMPVLVLSGAEDRVMPPARVAALADLIPGCARTEMAGVGHAAYLEDPVTYNALLSDFLG